MKYADNTELAHTISTVEIIALSGGFRGANAAPFGGFLRA